MLAAVLLPEGWKLPAGAVTAVGCFAGAGITAAFLFADSEQPESIVAGAAVRDRLGSFTGLLICAIGLLAAAVAVRHGLGRHRAEYYALLLAAAAGMVFLVTATNLMTLFLGLEWFSIALYVLCAYDVARERLARGRPEVPRRRRLRLGRAAVRIGVRLRRDRRARVRGDRGCDRSGRSSATTSSCSRASR